MAADIDLEIEAKIGMATNFKRKSGCFKSEPSWIEKWNE